MEKCKIVRATTVPMSLNAFCKGMLNELSQEYDVVALSSPELELEVVGKREGVRTIGVKMERHISPIQDFKSLCRLYRIFRKEKPYMVHSMTPKAGLLCMMSSWAARVPVRVHTFTGLVFPTSRGIKRRILMATDWLTCACATHIIPEGEGVKNDLLQYGITKKPLQVLGFGNVRGIDLDYYDRLPDVMERAKEIRRHDLVTFIAIGRLVGDKGINELVQAFDKLHAAYPNTRLILVGSEEKALDPLKKETLDIMQGSKAIWAVGQQKDIRPWLAASDVAVLASYREGFPNVVIEAGAMGLPQIVTDVNGAREIIINKRNGIIVPSKDAHALYGAMTNMLDAEYRAKLAEEARALIAQRYDQYDVRKHLYDYYHQILRK